MPHKLFIFIFAVASLSISSMPNASAQSGGGRPYEVSLQGASLLPYGIPHVKEILIGTDARVTLPTGKGKFEIDSFFANGEGTSYRVIAFDYRTDIGFDDFPAFAVIGLNADFYTPPAPNNKQLYTGGWHLGGGFLQTIAGGWSLREDVRYRLGPGTTLIIGLGLNYQFSN